jgi:hypothetical protein
MKPKIIASKYNYESWKKRQLALRSISGRNITITNSGPSPVIFYNSDGTLMLGTIYGLKS